LLDLKNLNCEFVMLAWVDVRRFILPFKFWFQFYLLILGYLGIQLRDFFFHLTNDLFLLVIVIIFSFKIRFIYCRCFIYYIIEWTWICFFFKTCLQRPSNGFLHYRELYPVSGKVRTTYLTKVHASWPGYPH